MGDVIGFQSCFIGIQVPGVPTDIRAMSEQRQLAVCWGDEQVDFPFKFLREECVCAHCVNEWTGEKMLDPATIPADISIQKMELVGNYALRIHWSDAHNSGLYTWDRLLELRNRIPSN